MPDATEVVRKLIEGGREALEEFAREYRLVVLKAVHVMARKFGASADDVEDAAAQVFVELLDREARVLKSFKGASAFTTWLTVVAYRVAAREFSRRARAKEVEESAPPASDTAPPADREVLDRLRELPELDRRALVLFHIEEASYKEIADRLGIPANQVGMVLLRAREKLAKSMGAGEKS
ncbi:MAG TPA: sigma-70 family RNA polymerase sigma factor [Planctomycetota bacterium]